jgi:hypothetical protein
MSVIPTSTTPVCYNHPNRETMLRCNRCDRPICTECAKPTPTGYRCKECIRGQQKIFNTAASIDYPIAFVAAGALSLIGSLIAGMLGFWGLLLAPVAGIAISEAVRWAVRRHRSPSLFLTAAAGTVCGALPSILVALLTGSFFSLIWPVAYLILVTPTVYYRLRGIQIG